jgi:hypothetical protein
VPALRVRPLRVRQANLLFGRVLTRLVQVCREPVHRSEDQRDLRQTWLLGDLAQPPFHLCMVPEDLGRERRRPPRSGPPLLLPLPDQHAGVPARLTLARAGCLL